MHAQKLKPDNLTQERTDALKASFPEAFADGKINWDVLRELLGAAIEDEDRPEEHFGLFWPGKREARKLAAQPSHAALHPAPGEGVNEETTRNLFIEGDNLEVLKLLRKAYAGRVKLIYIDPPYNTGNDFIYEDDFTDSTDDYLRKTGQMGEGGELLVSNPKSDGRFHSKWLNMMYPRLMLARELLISTGVICISIDDNEIYNLRSLMSEIFGEENFLGCFVWKRRTSSALADKLLSTDHEYIVVYQRPDFTSMRGTPKTYERYSNPDNDPNGPWAADNLTVGMTKDQRPNQYYDLVDPRTRKVYPPNPNRVWVYAPESMAKAIAAERIIFPSDTSNRPMFKRYQRELKSDVDPISTWIRSTSEKSEPEDHTILRSGLNSEGNRQIQELFGGVVFNYTKPASLIISLVRNLTENDDIVLDFFAGSCTTADAVSRLNHEENSNRRFVVVQIPEPIESSDFSTIAEIGKERIRRVIKKLQTDVRKQSQSMTHELPYLGFKVFKLGQSSFKRWEHYDGSDMQRVQDMFSQTENPLVEGWNAPDALTEMMLLEGFPLDSTVIEQKGFKHNHVMLVESDACAHRLFVCLDPQIKADTITQMALIKRDVFVCLDSALTDETKMQLSDVCRLKVV